MGWINKLSIALLVGCMGITFSNEVLSQSSREEKADLSRIMQQQEEALGILYPGKPKIEWSFDKLDRDFSIKLWAMFHAAALYDKRTDTILIDQEKCNFSIRHKIIKKVYGFDPCLDPKHNLAHELGHYYVDQLHEAITKKDYVPEDKAKRMVGEGIAVYFETIIIPRKIECGNLPYLTQRGNIYTAGYCLVHPIIEKYRSRGIEALVLNPMTKKELDFPEEYQRRIKEWIEKRSD